MIQNQNKPEVRPDEYEQIVAEYFQRKGYTVSVSPYTNDYGVDVFASKSDEKIAVQAKMFGNTSRRINRQMVMELHGAKDYFDCTRAILATDGQIIENAKEVAAKLNIEVLFVPAVRPSGYTNLKEQAGEFESIWEKYVMPLEGQTLRRENGDTNKILKVDWSGIERITSNGKKQKIKIEIFRTTINHLLKKGTITRTYINEEYKERASAGVVLILSSSGKFKLTRNPTGLAIKGKS